MVAQRRDLRQVRDAHDLMIRGDGTQFFAHDARRGAGDAGVDLVEDHGRDPVQIADDALHGQHDAGQLAAGGDLCEGLERFALIRADQELHAVRTFFAGRGVFDRNGEGGVREVQVRQFSVHFLLQRLRRSFPQHAQPRGGRFVLLLIQLFLAFQVFQFSVRVLDRLQLPLRLVSIGKHGFQTAAVFAL